MIAEYSEQYRLYQLFPFPEKIRPLHQINDFGRSDFNINSTGEFNSLNKLADMIFRNEFENCTITMETVKRLDKLYRDRASAPLP